MINFFLHNWLLVALLAPLFWAIVNIVDVYFVEEIYENEYDGTIITGFAQVLPLLAIPFVGLIVPDMRIIIMAMLGGFFLTTSYFFYYKTLFITSDATLVLILWNIVAIVVPIMAFLFLGERLSPIHYLGIIITFSGATFIYFSSRIKEENIGRVFALMSGAILFFSLSMILTKNVYSNTTFQGGIMFFFMGSVLAGLFFYAWRLKKYGKGNTISIGRKYFKWFFGAEILTLGGVLTSQRAIDLSPSVSFVSAIESIQPAFIIILSAIFFILFSYFYKIKKEMAERIYNEQLAGIGSKIMSIIVMAIGIYMLNL